MDWLTRARRRLGRALDRFQLSETAVLGGLALAVGLLSGIGVWLFKALIALVHTAAFGWLGGALQPLGPWTIALLPVLGGLVVGLLMHVFVGEERHHGVAGVIEAVALAGGRLRFWRIPAKTVAAALAIGAGASVGPEDPSVQIGANIGSLAGQTLRLSDERVRALVAAGAAGGIAAAFNAPIAGVFFALEIVLGELSGAALSVVVLAAVIAAVFTQAVAGPQPAFAVRAYGLGSPWELPLYLGLGLVAGPVAALYIRALYAAQDAFHALRGLPRWLRPALAGLAVGAVGAVLPQIMGVGYPTIEAVLGGEALALGLLVALLAAKLVLTAVSVGGGFPGGVFAPALFLGATLGAAYGAAIGMLMPAVDIAPGAFALVGMAAVLAGTVHAPLTAILLLFEMTNDYRIILPVMFAVVVSLLVSQRLQRDSVYALGLARKGVRLERGRDVEVLQAITVGEVMRPDPPVLHETGTLAEAAAQLLQGRAHGLPVVDSAGRLAGILTVQDVDRVLGTPSDEALTVGAVCTRDLLVAYPDETIGAAMRRMGTRDVGRLPVVARDDPRRLVGMLRRVELVRAYDAALTQWAARRHRAHQARLDAVGLINVEEVVVAPGAACAGRPVKDVPWPRECVIASVRRGRRVLIPHGDTVLRPGDVVVAVAEGEARAALLHLCGARS